MCGKLRNLLITLIIFGHLILDSILSLILGWFLGPKRTCPPIDGKSDFIKKSATELAELIRTKRLTSLTIVQAYFDRIKEVNPILNAVVDGPFKEALEQAAELDDRIAKGYVSEQEFSEKPLLGVPFTTKEANAVRDKLYTLGLISRKNCKSDEDSECVRLMRAAGAIIIATTNVPEASMWAETRNSLFGQTNNPYDTRRTAGGSSGGEGSLISACGSPIGIGSDIGGSIRIPAFSCGLFGHKPTAGTVNVRGCNFRTGTDPDTMEVVGPISRYAQDLSLVMKILANKSDYAKLKLDEKVNIKRLKYYFISQVDNLTTSPVCEDLQSAMYNVRNHFSEITGNSIEEIKLPHLDKAFKMWLYWISKEPDDLPNILGNGTPPNLFIEICKKLIGKSDFTLAAIYGLITSKLSFGDGKDIENMTQECEEELNRILGNDGVLLYPSAPKPPQFHYFGLVKLFSFSYFNIFNVLKVPATQVPLGLNASGLPLGLQVVATRYRDRHCFAVAEEIENRFHGWVPPFKTRD